MKSRSSSSSSGGGKPKQVSLFDFFNKKKKKVCSTSKSGAKPLTQRVSSSPKSTNATATKGTNQAVEASQQEKTTTPLRPKQNTDDKVNLKNKHLPAKEQQRDSSQQHPTPPSATTNKRARPAELEDVVGVEKSTGTDPNAKMNEQQSESPVSKKKRVRESLRIRRPASSSSRKRVRQAELVDTDEEENEGAPPDEEEESEFDEEIEGDETVEESDLEVDADEEEDYDNVTPVRKKHKTSTKSSSSLPGTRQITESVSKSSSSSKTAPSSIEKTPLSSFAAARKITPPSETIRRQQPFVQPSFCSTTTSSTTTTTTQKPTMFVKNAVNPMGSHLHHHLKCLHPPRDSQGRTPDHDDYDCRTLRVSKAEYEKLNGSSMTNGVEQWWDLKAQYFDVVLLFKTGKFYEMYNMDADVGVQVLGLIYMKDHVAHAGFPEKSYGVMADKLVRAGYKVARVEQTETVEMFKERKKAWKGKNSPKVVNREVCSVLTLGTRTCCFMDDVRRLEQHPDAIADVGPLLAIAEKPLDAKGSSNAENGDEENGNDDCTLIREFGITVVDAPRGWITVGQFQDDCLCSNLQTLMAAYAPSEILYQGSNNPDKTRTSSKHHQTIKTLMTAYRANSVNPCRMEVIKSNEFFPKSTALDPSIRKALQRSNPVHPWKVEETIHELRHRQHKFYFGNSSGPEENSHKPFTTWPPVLRDAVQAADRNATVLSSFGAALYYLQRNLIDAEVLSMGVVKEYTCPKSTFFLRADQQVPPQSQTVQQDLTMEEQQCHSTPPSSCNADTNIAAGDAAMSLEGTTLYNLEIIANTDDNKEAGSLWSRLHHTKTPHGARLLRAWVLRPLLRKEDIDRRADAVEELVSGGSAGFACEDARKVLAKCGDLERLLSRVHSMSGGGAMNDTTKDTSAPGAHPNERAVLYEEADYTKRKVGDFSKVLNGLKQATKIPGLFQELKLRDGGLLAKIVQHPENGGCFPDIAAELDWYFENFDCEKAAEGLFEPNRGVDAMFDQACATVEEIQSELKHYKDEMCRDELRPSSQARSTWTYINTKPDSKDKYLIELPASIRVPQDWIVKAKRGKGAKQVNKYRTPEVEEKVMELEKAWEAIAERKARAVQLIFAKFDAKRDFWAAAAQATALLDALCAMAQLASQPGYVRPRILDSNETRPSVLSFRQARHPCVEGSAASPEFIPNDLSLGSVNEQNNSERVLLLSGPNMGGKSTFLRQTCILAILAQIGSFVPAEECELTPIDRIYTRLGASDRILLGQSTFFVELSETTSALRGATNRSLVIMDELGRGTSTFDGTAIAFAAVKHLVERNKCLALFATHYHNLLDDWSSHPLVRLGHMECMVEEDEGDGTPSRVTFLYTLGRGACPKSFGINVARLAGLPTGVLIKAGNISNEFERDIGSSLYRNKVEAAIQSNNWEMVRCLWQQAQ